MRITRLGSQRRLRHDTAPISITNSADRERGSRCSRRRSSRARSKRARLRAPRAPARSGTDAGPAAVDEDGRPAERGAAADRALDLARRPHLDARAAGRGARRRRPCGRRAAAARRPRSGSTGSASSSPAPDRHPPPVEGEAVVEQLEAVEVALGLARRAEHRRDQLDPVALAGADQDVAGAEGVAGLHPGRPGRREQQVVEGVDPPRRAQAAQHGAARRRRSGRRPGSRSRRRLSVARSRGARVVARLVEPDRVGVVGVGEAERRRSRFISRDEARLPSRPRRARGRRRRRCRCAGSGRRAGRAR